jgi:XTP/dITP diphosphohydrolase
MKLLLATRNRDKISEIEEILCGLSLDILTYNNFPDLPEVIENKDTLAGNAEKKALESAEFAGIPTIADDTGLFVEALNGAPGVYSSRYAGENCSYKDNRVKLLSQMKGINNRKAQFKTVVALAFPGKVIATAEGIVEGEITEQEIGDRGFGYDSIFRARETGRTYAEMSDKEKNTISHRARALQNIIPIINSLNLDKI